MKSWFGGFVAWSDATAERLFRWAGKGWALALAAGLIMGLTALAPALASWAQLRSNPVEYARVTEVKLPSHPAGPSCGHTRYSPDPLSVQSTLVIINPRPGMSGSPIYEFSCAVKWQVGDLVPVVRIRQTGGMLVGPQPTLMGGVKAAGREALVVAVAVYIGWLVWRANRGRRRPPPPPQRSSWAPGT
jgi:hypothetical protein